MRINELQVCHLTEPMGFELAPPVFSWVVSDTPSKKQSKARLTVYCEGTCLYDSGESTAPDSLGTAPELQLLPRKRYTWKVQVWGDSGDYGEAESSFETGKMEEAWVGRWIRGEEPLALLEKEFLLDKEPRSARIYITGLGLYRLFINGAPASDELFTPGLNAYDRWVQVQTYDIGHLLRKGENRLEIWLAGGISRGRFSFTKADDYEYCPYDCAIAEVRIRDEAGEQVIPTDESWLWRTSPIRESGIYDGERWDWGAEVHRGSAVLCAPPVGPLRDRLSPPVRIVEERKPAAVLHTPAGETVLDMGQNMVGWLRFADKGEKGQTLCLKFGEQLEHGCFSRANLRSARAEFRWTCDGEPRVAEPFFTWYGFRYVLLEGFTGPVQAEDFTGCVVSSDLRETGRLSVGHRGLSRLLENVRWSQRGNFLDVPTDCPQRDEREGWTGDAQIFADTACFNMDCAAFYTKYMADMLEEQKKAEGCVPLVVPFARNRSKGFEGGAVGWADAAAVIPWTVYLHYGDRALLRRQFENMEAWVHWVARQEDWSGQHHFGDWLALDREGEPEGLDSRDKRVGKTSLRFLCLCYAFYSAYLAARAAKELGEPEKAAAFTSLSENNKALLQREFFSPGGELLCRTQTACILALYLGLSPRAQQTEAELLSLLKESGHLTTGFLGTPWLLEVLPAKAAWDLLLREDFPSWLYEVKLGATTIWERWNSLTPEGTFSETGMNSLNHYAYGSVESWVYRHAAGIQPLDAAPGFRRFRFAPKPDPRLGGLECRLASPCGEIVSKWSYEGSEIAIRLTVPFGSSAEVILPDGRSETVCSGTYQYRVSALGGEAL